ncbi:MAG: ABC transporter ATP-binding protein [Pseudomonadota bacterium]
MSQQSFRAGGVIRTIWRLADDQQGVLVRSFIYKIIQGMFEALPVGVLIYLIHVLRTGGLTPDFLWLATGLIALCVVGNWGAGLAANRSAWIATFELFGNLRIRGLNQLRRLPLAYHTTNRTGDAVTTLTQDISALEGFAHEPMQAFLGAIAAPFVVFVVLMFQDVPMAAATVVSILAALPAFFWSDRLFKSLAGKRQDMQAEASSRMIEYIQGLPVIRAFGMSGERIQTFQQALDDFRNVNNLLAAKLAPTGMLFVGIVFLGIPLVLFMGSYWLLGGTLDAGVFIIFAILSLRVYLPMAFAAQQFEQIRLADASLDRVARLFDAEIEQEPEHPVALPASFDVAFDDVVFGYEPTHTVIDKVSFTALAGKVTAIVGPSGAGKSTLLKLISRFDIPQQGTVRFGEAGLAQLSTAQVFDAVTVVFQDVYLFPGTIRDNIAFGREHVTDEQVIAAAKAAQADSFIQRMPQGYNTPVGEAGARLSGGERQRISIARAILKDAPIILLDEATAALDSTNERLVQEGIAALSRGKTVIVVAHRLATIQAADQILVLDSGKLVEAGQHDTLIANEGMYAKLWAERTRASEWRLSRDAE